MMSHAEALMEHYPDSSKAILSKIDKDDLNGDEDKARYALLMSMALDKNYIDTTTFDVLQPAIDYYLKKGSPDERLRTYYYQGRIFQNQGDDASAMNSYLKGRDVPDITDSLFLAKLIVAESVMYFKQYKTDEFINENLKAAKIYNIKNKPLPEMRSYGKALEGYTILGDRVRADSIRKICEQKLKLNPQSLTYVLPSLISHTIRFGEEDELEDIISYIDLRSASSEVIINIALAYSKINKPEKGLSLLNSIVNDENTDSLKLLLVKADILESDNDYKQALDAYKQYVSSLEEYHNQLLTGELIFIEDKYESEISILKTMQHKNYIIWFAVFGCGVLILVAAFLFYRYKFVQSKKIMTENENFYLKIANDNLIFEKNRLEEERNELEKLSANYKGMEEPIRNLIRDRIAILNGLLAKEISMNDTYARPYQKLIDSIQTDRNKFILTIRKQIEALYPEFMTYISSFDFSNDEISYICLCAIGLQGKEVGGFLQIKGHYNISSSIRKKIGLGEHDTNLKLHIQKMMEKLQ